MKNSFCIAFAALALAMALVLALVVGCKSHGSVTDEFVGLGYRYSRMRYQYTEIDGMPCIVAAFRGYSGVGITCDWSKWEK